jgi:tetratricopeptide (TPR) repeat protein
MSQEDLAGSEYTSAYISHLENGRRSASRDALNHIAAGLEVDVALLVTGRDPDLDVQLQIDVDRTIAQIHLGELEAATETLEAVRKRARKEGFTRSESAAEEGLGLIAQRQGRWADALDHFTRAEERLSDEPPEARTSVVTGIARCLFATNKLNHAIHVLETHHVELNQDGPGDPTALMQTYSAMVGPYFEAGFRDRAAVVAEEACKLEARVQDPEHIACSYINRAHILLEQGHRDEAIRSLARAEDLFKQIGWRDSAAKAAVSQSMAALDGGDLEASERLARSALSELEQLPNSLDQARTLNVLARIERLRERPAESLAHLEAVGRLLGEQKSLEQAWRVREMGLCHMDLEDPKRAERLLRQAMTIYREAKSPNHIATTAAYLGDALRLLGRTDEALRVYREGLTAVEDMAV